ncbi:hypothetical protein DL93DRAFT_488644 [Clavulina sp. PMI_390]|nr:hypothetical protein DL93DRAFT_488644 [Clavulina sp. PMI_390]
MHVQTLQVYRTWSRSAEEFEQEFKDLEKTVDDSLPVNNADGGSNRDIQPQQMMERVSFDHATAQGPHTVSSISSELDSLSLDSSSLAPNTIGREEVIFDLWFALFAPSAARAVLPIARRHFSLPPNHVTHSHTRQTPDDEHTDNRAPLAGSPGTEAIAVTNSEPDAGKLNHPNPHNIHQGNAPTPFPSSLSSSSSSSRPSTSFTAAPLSGSSSTNSPLSAVPASPLSGSPWPEVTVRERVFSLPLGDAASTPNAAGVGARVRVAAIGPTTAAFLRSDAEDAGIYVEVVPEKPTPDCLAESIWQASRSKERVGR